MSGHSFCMIYEDAERTGQYAASYEIKRAESGETEPVGERKILLAKPASRIYCHDDNISPSTDLPVQLYANLSMLMNRYAPREASFNWIKIDNEFLDNAAEYFRRNVVDRLAFIQPKITADPDKFADFLLKLRPTKLVMWLGKQQTPSEMLRIYQVFDEKFVNEFAGSTELRLYVGRFDNDSHYWIPSVDLMDIIVKFKQIELRFMRLTPNLLIKLILLCLNETNPCSYRFTITDQITPGHLTSSLDPAKYSIKEHQEYPWFSVKNVDNGWTVDVCPFEGPGMWEIGLHTSWEESD